MENDFQPLDYHSYKNEYVGNFKGDVKFINCPLNFELGSTDTTCFGYRIMFPVRQANPNKVTGLNEDDAETVFKPSIYPNPSSNKLIAQLPSKVPVVINVYNSSGKLMGSWQFSESQEIDCSTWSQGLYLFYIHTEDKEKVYIHKQIIQR